MGEAARRVGELGDTVRGPWGRPGLDQARPGQALERCPMSGLHPHWLTTEPPRWCYTTGNVDGPSVAAGLHSVLSNVMTK